MRSTHLSSVILSEVGFICSNNSVRNTRFKTFCLLKSQTGRCEYHRISTVTPQKSCSYHQLISYSSLEVLLGYSVNSFSGITQGKFFSARKKNLPVTLWGPAEFKTSHTPRLHFIASNDFAIVTLQYLSQYN